MNQIVDSLFELIRVKIFGVALDREKFEKFSEEQWKALFSLSSKHDLSHIVGSILIDSDLLPKGECRDLFQKAVFLAVFRYQNMTDGYGKIVKAFLTAGIDFLPLKGMVTRNLYPEPWLRTSCDIDILVAESDAERAVSVLGESAGFSLETKSEHDYQLYSENNVHLELHFCPLDPSEKAKTADLPLENLMEKAVKNADGFKELPPELFYYYHVAHMATHFHLGGCGIRPFLDLSLMLQKLNGNPEKTKRLFDEGGLTAFEAGCRRLATVWFGDAEYDELSLQMADYLLRGGVYGSHSNLVAFERQKKGSRFRYLLLRVFLPYRSMKNMFPVLVRFPILLPVFEVVRWIRLPFTGRLGSRIDELHKVTDASRESEEIMQKMLQSLDLLG